MPEFSSNNQFNQFQGGSDHTSEFDPQDISDNKVISALSYLGILFFLPLVCCPNSRFGKFHANQGLVLLIVGVILQVISGIVGMILRIVPVLGAIVSGLIIAVIGIVVLIYMVYGLVNTLNGRAKELPIIGKIKLLN